MSESTIPLCEPVLAGRELEYLTTCVETSFVSSVGPFVDRFEREFAAYTGSRFAVACATGTAALHVAMRLFGVDARDEVAVPTLTFIASANPVVYERATPLLCDSERETWNLDPAIVCEEIERRARLGLRQIKMVEAVHLLGHPAHLDELAVTCERHGVVLIEDASEALGARWMAGRFAGRHVGTVGRVGCFSFNGNKIITAGGGGMITTDDEGLARRAKHLTTQARLAGPEYRHDEIGYNYRLTNLAAAVGVAQLEQLEGFIAAKRRIADRYDQALATIEGLEPMPRAPWAAATGWLYTMRVQPSYGQDRRQLLERLARAGIHTRPIWSPLHSMPMYAHAPRLGGAIAEDVFSTALSLPCSSNLDERQQARVVEHLRARH